MINSIGEDLECWVEHPSHNHFQAVGLLLPGLVARASVPSRANARLQVPIMVVCVLVVLWKVNIPLPPAIREITWIERVKRIDFLGAFTMVVAVTCLLLPVSMKSSQDIK